MPSEVFRLPMRISSLLAFYSGLIFSLCSLWVPPEVFRLPMRISSLSANFIWVKFLWVENLCLPRFSACQCGYPRYWHFIGVDSTLWVSSECLPRSSACQCGCPRFWQFYLSQKFPEYSQINSNLPPKVFRLLMRISLLLATPFDSRFHLCFPFCFNNEKFSM